MQRGRHLAYFGLGVSTMRSIRPRIAAAAAVLTDAIGLSRSPGSASLAAQLGGKTGMH